MNKRQSKKKMDKLFNVMMNARKNNTGVMVRSQIFVDLNGKECTPMEKGARFRKVRPQISYIGR